jgi:hypothetical protein
MGKPCNACKIRIANKVTYLKDLCCAINICPSCGYIVNKKAIASVKAPDLAEVIKFFVDNGYTEQAGIKAWNYYNDAHWHNSQGKAVLNWKQTMRGNWFKPEYMIGAKTTVYSGNASTVTGICDRVGCGNMLPNDVYVEDKSTYCSIKCMKGE